MAVGQGKCREREQKCEAYMVLAVLLCAESRCGSVVRHICAWKPHIERRPSPPAREHPTILRAGSNFSHLNILKQHLPLRYHSLPFSLSFYTPHYHPPIAQYGRRRSGTSTSCLPPPRPPARSDQYPSLRPSIQSTSESCEREWTDLWAGCDLAGLDQEIVKLGIRADLDSHSMITPSRASMPAPRPRSLCSALLCVRTVTS